MIDHGELRFDDDIDKLPGRLPLENEGEVIKSNGKKMTSLVDQCRLPLITISSKFPYDFFPDTLIVDEHKVSVILREWGSEEIHSILLEDISDIEVTSSPFTSQLQIIDSSNPRRPIIVNIKNLKHSDALLSRDIIQGLIKAKREGINFESLSQDEIKNQIRELGNIKDGKLVNEALPLQQHVRHYYGDIVRILFLAGSVLLLITLPFINTLLPFSLSFSLFGILSFTILAGLINPHHLFLAIAETLFSLGGFILFETLALKYLNFNSSNLLFGIIMQLFALGFILALYFSIKTVRGFILRKNEL